MGPSNSDENIHPQTLHDAGNRSHRTSPQTRRPKPWPKPPPCPRWRWRRPPRPGPPLRHASRCPRPWWTRRSRDCAWGWSRLLSPSWRWPSGTTPARRPRGRFTRAELVAQVQRWVGEGAQVFTGQESCGFGFVLHRERRLFVRESPQTEPAVEPPGIAAGPRPRLRSQRSPVPA